MDIQQVAKPLVINIMLIVGGITGILIILVCLLHIICLLQQLLQQKEVKIHNNIHINIMAQTPPCYIAMNNFKKHMKDGETWYSPPFYSGLRGYKMRLLVCANGDGIGAGTHVSVFVQIIKGEYDDVLIWPYRGTVTYMIINWTDDKNHKKRSADYSEEDALQCGNKPTGEDNIPWGNTQAFSHDQYYYADKQFIFNNILYIKVSSVTGQLEL